MSHLSLEDEAPRTLDRRSCEQEDLRRLLQIGNLLANYVEITSDPAFNSGLTGVNPVGMRLTSAFRRQLQRFQQRATRQAVTSMRGRS